MPDAVPDQTSPAALGGRVLAMSFAALLAKLAGLRQKLTTARIEAYEACAEGLTEAADEYQRLASALNRTSWAMPPGERRQWYSRLISLQLEVRQIERLLGTAFSFYVGSWTVCSAPQGYGESGTVSAVPLFIYRGPNELYG